MPNGLPKRVTTVLASLGLLAGGITVTAPAASAAVSPSSVTFDCSSTAGIPATTFTGQIGDTFTITNTPTTTNDACSVPPNSVVSGSSMIADGATETFTITSAGTFAVEDNGANAVTMTVVLSEYNPPTPPPSIYTVSLNADGGSCPISSLRGTSGTWAALPSDCTKSGFTLSGWSTPFGASTFAPGQSIALTGDNTLTAQWTRNAVVRIVDVTGFCNQEIQLPVGSNYQLPTTCSRPGYQVREFTYPDGAPVAPGNSVSITGDTSFFVQWQELGTVIFQSGFGCEGTSVEAPVDSTVKPSISCSPDVQLIGWTTDQLNTQEPAPVANGKNAVTVSDFRSVSDGVQVAPGQQTYWPVVFRQPSTPALGAREQFDSLGRRTNEVRFRVGWTGSKALKARVTNKSGQTVFECERDSSCLQKVPTFDPTDESGRAPLDSGLFDYTATVIGEGIVDVAGEEVIVDVPSAVSQAIRVAPILPTVLPDLATVLRRQPDGRIDVGMRAQGTIVGIAADAPVLWFVAEYERNATGEGYTLVSRVSRLLRTGPGDFDVTVYSPFGRITYFYFKLGGKNAPIQQPICATGGGYGCIP